MNLITTFLDRLWDRNPGADAPAPRNNFTDHRDRSSMAELVRILQACDREPAERRPA
jgi:hypothetical protein